MAMENDRVSSESRRSSSAMRGFFAAKVGNERDGVAPKCNCGVYAVWYLSNTSKNPNRLFFGCPFFKIGDRYCKYFLWLDRHAAKFRNTDGAPVRYGEDEDVVNVHFAKLNVDNRLANLEARVAAIEKKKTMNMFLIWIGVIVVFLLVCVSMV
ncbi:hypothetical protein PIB30_007621 [Stylosanthes scabra]|uniref:GRF-type domain-containing protein n=1 Tax=Stylosanthes scabra TaxID=79078 RepID=A0ABU6V3Z5_9FABA|nr:hypothetical protein [Stylosanthes scabra]